MPYAGEMVDALTGQLPSGEAVTFVLADHRSRRRFGCLAVTGAAAELAAHSLAGGQPTMADKARVVAACSALPELDDAAFEHWWGRAPVLLLVLVEKAASAWRQRCMEAQPSLRCNRLVPNTGLTCPSPDPCRLQDLPQSERDFAERKKLEGLSNSDVMMRVFCFRGGELACTGRWLGSKAGQGCT